MPRAHHRFPYEDKRCSLHCCMEAASLEVIITTSCAVMQIQILGKANGVKGGSIHPHPSFTQIHSQISAVAALGASRKMCDGIQSQTRGRRFIPPPLSGLAGVKGAAPRAQLTATGGGPPPRWTPQRTLRREEFLIQDYFPQTCSQLD